MSSSGHIWDDYRDEDYLWAKLPVFRHRVDRARSVVREWMSRCERPYIACSGGKDSVSMLHLIQTIRREAGMPLLPVMWHNSGVEWPGVPQVFERLRARGLIDSLIIVCPEEDVLALKQAQLAGLISARTKDERALFRPIREEIGRRGWNGVAVGLRKGESAGRLVSRATHGLIYHTQDGLLHCTPLGDWEWQDVYAYIALHGLPLHPIYSAPLLQLEHRGRIRLSWWASTDHHRHGEITWVATVYPEIFARLRAALPEVRRFA